MHERLINLIFTITIILSAREFSVSILSKGCTIEEDGRDRRNSFPGFLFTWNTFFIYVMTCR